ncbi:MAG: hypothetical protein WDO73_36250 [Ignavibacteriota bacterium]
MSEIRYGPWQLRVDVEPTVRAYEQVEQGSAEGCDCDPCKNYVLVRSEVFPVDVLALFQSVGIDFRKEVELAHYSRMPSGLHLYGAWFYVYGSIASGPNSWTTVEGTLKKPTFHRVNPTFEIGFTQVEKGREPFEHGSCVQVDFYVELPWRLEAPEPD